MSKAARRTERAMSGARTDAGIWVQACRIRHCLSFPNTKGDAMRRRDAIRAEHRARRRHEKTICRDAERGLEV